MPCPCVGRATAEWEVALPNPPVDRLGPKGRPATQQGTCNPRTPALAALKAAAGLHPAPCGYPHGVPRRLPRVDAPSLWPGRVSRPFATRPAFPHRPGAPRAGDMLRGDWMPSGHGQAFRPDLNQSWPPRRTSTPSYRRSKLACQCNEKRRRPRPLIGRGASPCSGLDPETGASPHN